MQINDLNRLFDNMYRANHQMWEYMLILSEDQLTTDLEHLSGSVHSRLVQMICTENLWVNFLWHGEVEFLQEHHFPTLDAIRQEWDALEEEMRDYLSTLTSTDVEREVEPDFFDLAPVQIGDILLQIVNDAAHRRDQIMASIFYLGGSKIAQDCIYSRESPT